ncbi:MAG: hypothetical protein AB8B50_13385 [Pirellulaceae bacterium]
MKKLISLFCLAGTFAIAAYCLLAAYYLLPKTAGQPLHCDVFLGASDPIALHFIADAQTIYLDRNKDGMADPEEFCGTSRLDEPLQLTSRDKTTSYLLAANLMMGESAISDALPQKLQIKLTITKSSSADSNAQLVIVEDGYVTMSNTPDTSNPLNVDATRMMNLLAFYPEDLSPGDDFLLHAELANSQRSAESWSAVNLEEEWQESLFPDGTRPVLSMSYQVASTSQPVTEKYYLDQFC